MRVIPVSGARTDAVNTAAIPRTAKAVGVGASAGKSHWPAWPTMTPLMVPRTRMGAKIPPGVPEA